MSLGVGALLGRAVCRTPATPLIQDMCIHVLHVLNQREQARFKMFKLGPSQRVGQCACGWMTICGPDSEDPENPDRPILSSEEKIRVAYHEHRHPSPPEVQEPPAEDA